MTLDLLAVSLSAAVPLRIMELERLPRDEVMDDLDAHRDEWSHLIAERSDVLLFGGKAGEPARIHNVLVDALAHMAFVPGGVKFLDMHFEAGAL